MSMGISKRSAGVFGGGEGEEDEAAVVVCNVESVVVVCDVESEVVCGVDSV